MRREDWTWNRVKYELALRKLTLAQIAEEHQLSKGYFSSIPHCQRVRTQQLVADALGMHPWDIWPSRYDAKGTPKSNWAVLKQIKASNTPNRCLVDNSAHRRQGGVNRA